MTSDLIALSIFNSIRLNGYEVTVTPRGSVTLVTILDLERNAETCLALTEENRLSLLDRLASDYCTPQQQESLFTSLSTAGLAKVA